MATTTNYGWTTPDDTALVKDGAAAIRTLGTSVDTTTKNLNPSTTLGDIEYRSSTANTNTRLGIGTAGQVLTVSSGVPAWTTLASASAASASSFVATNQSTSSTSYTGLTTAQAVTLTTGTKVMVAITASVLPVNLTNRYGRFSYAISGATTKSASDNQSAILYNRSTITDSAEPTTISAVYFETVTAGSNTFTMQFKVNADSSEFQNRQLLVIDLGS
jgi:hypothetical protein